MEPTVTDAMAVCGWLGHSQMAYGQLQIDVGQARAAVTRLAEKIGRTAEEAAQAILDIAISEMFVEVEKLASRAGVDLREFTLMPFGGGGPMLGAFLAREFKMARVIGPPRPGVVSALGGLVADLRGDFIRTVFTHLSDEAAPHLHEALESLAAEGRGWLARQGHAGAATLNVSADMRYVGQSFEIEVPIQAAWITENKLGSIEEAFHAMHARLYDFHDPDGAIEIVNLRLSAVGAGPALDLPVDTSDSGKAAEPAREIPVFTGKSFEWIGLYRRDRLRPGSRFAGPAVVAQEDTTFAIPTGTHVEVDRHLNLHLTFSE